MGLKVRLAAYWLLVCLGVGAGLFIAADRLMRQLVLAERKDYAKAFLAEASGKLSSCPDKVTSCPAWENLKLGLAPAVWAISLVDERGRLLDASRAELRAEALWDALDSLPASERAVIESCAAFRCLWLTQPLAGHPEKLLVAIELESAFAQARAVAKTLLVFSLLVALGGAFLGWLLSLRLVVWPLERLLRQAEKFSESGEEFSLDAARPGTLNIAFQRMWRRIEQDRRQLEEQIEKLKELNRQLQLTQQSLLRSEKLASVGRLAAGVAHEVGNPLSAILGYLTLIKDEKTMPGERAEMIERLEEEIGRIDQVIRSLLNYSRPAPPRVGPVNAREAAESALQLIRPQKEFKNIKFRLEVDPELTDCRADPALLRQVLVNLMLNALDALSAGGSLWLRAAQVERSASGQRWYVGKEPLSEGQLPPWFSEGDLHRLQLPRDGKWLEQNSAGVVFSVVDNGCGIAEENLAKVFDPFFTTKEPGKGTGLGLAICHSAIEAMGGEIWLWSRPGMGTQVSFILPLDRPQDHR